MSRRVLSEYWHLIDKKILYSENSRIKFILTLDEFAFRMTFATPPIVNCGSVSSAVSDLIQRNTFRFYPIAPIALRLFVLF